MKKCLCLLLVLLLLPLAALADEAPYVGYSYNRFGDDVPAPIGYEVKQMVTSRVMGTALSSPQDMYYDKYQDELYVVDSGNKRIVVLDSNYNFVRQYTGFGDTQLAHPMGLMVMKNGDIYVTDDVMDITLRGNQAGELLQVFSRPVSDLFDSTITFKPKKVVVDSAGRVYVLALGVYQGLVCYNPDGSFLNYFGAAQVETTPKMVLQKLWRSLMTRQQRANMEAFIPIEYVNIAIDDEDMVYAAVAATENFINKAMTVLNPMGINIIRHFNFANMLVGDMLPEENGIYTALNRSNRTIIQFTDVGPILFFGGQGTQDGLFQDPVAIERIGSDILILDAQTGNITVFRLTEFGQKIHEGSILYQQGRYVDSIQPWLDVLKLDNNYNMAYRGLGKAYYQLEDYEQAMYYFKLGNYRDHYSDAYKEYTLGLIRANMGWIVGALLLLFIAFKLHGAYRKKHPKPKKQIKNGLLSAPLYCMAHPYDGFERMKHYGFGSVKSGALVVALFFVVMVVQYVATGFIFNMNRLDRLNVPLLLLGTVGSFLLVFISNYAVSSLMSNCEGKTHELFISFSYALMPTIIGILLKTILSNFVDADLGIFLNTMLYICFAWSGIMLLVGVYHANQLSFSHTLLNLFLTILAIVIVLVLLVLAYSLVQQLWVFITTLYNEMMYRM